MTDFDLKYRFGMREDLDWLAQMNQQLIRDEGHRNKMTVMELKERMANFLQADYNAVIVSQADEDIGYALYRQDSDYMYLRQIFIKKEMRRKGIGRKLIQWLKNGPWKDFKIIRTEVLVNNKSAFKFWEAMGFETYCLTMEMENQ
jgi:ribosomal protein S18 acetylase RimI-like enzyme